MKVTNHITYRNIGSCKHELHMKQYYDDHDHGDNAENYDDYKVHREEAPVDNLFGGDVIMVIRSGSLLNNNNFNF